MYGYYTTNPEKTQYRQMPLDYGLQSSGIYRYVWIIYFNLFIVLQNISRTKVRHKGEIVSLYAQFRIGVSSR